MRGVDHQRRAGHGGVAGDVPEELLHFGGAVQHGVVHVDVDDGSAALDLPGGHLQGGVVVARSDEFRELPRACDVGALADVGKTALPHVQADGLQTAHVRPRVGRGQRTRGQAAYGLRDGADVVGRGAAAAADQVHQPVLRHLPQGGGRLDGGFIVGAHLVGQPGVGVAAHGAVRPGGHVGEQRGEVGGAERAVEPEAERPGVPDRAEKGFQRLSGEGASAAVAHRYGDDQRQCRRFRNAADRIEGGLRVEGVEAGFQQQGIRTAFHQAADLIGIRLRHLVEGAGAPGGVGEVLRQGEGFAGGAERSGHPDLPGGGVGGLPGQGGARPGEFARLPGKAVVGLGDGVGAEGVGGQDIRSGVDVGFVDAPDDVRMAEVEGFVIAGKALALEHRAHRPVQDQDPFRESFPQSVHQKQSLSTLMTFSLRPIV